MKKVIGMLLLSSVICFAQDKKIPIGMAGAPLGESRVALSRFSAVDPPPSADPDASFWKGAPSVIAVYSALGQIVPGHRTEIRSGWTSKNLYFPFVCPYKQLICDPTLRRIGRQAISGNGMWRRSSSGPT